MFGFVKKIFSAPKVIDKSLDIIDKGVDGIGKLFFTEQEKAELSQKTYETWLEVQRVTANESSIRSITRRVLAISIIGTFLLFLIMAAFAYPFMQSWSAYLLRLAQALDQLVLAVAVFYFGVHILRSFKQKQ